MSIEFWITSLIVVASPGTGVLYTLAAGLSRGARASLFAALACTLLDIPRAAPPLAEIVAELLAATAERFYVALSAAGDAPAALGPFGVTGVAEIDGKAVSRAATGSAQRNGEADGPLGEPPLPKRAEPALTTTSGPVAASTRATSAVDSG